MEPVFWSCACCVVQSFRSRAGVLGEACGGVPRRCSCCGGRHSSKDTCLELFLDIVAIHRSCARRMGCPFPRMERPVPSLPVPSLPVPSRSRSLPPEQGFPRELVGSSRGPSRRPVLVTGDVIERGTAPCRATRPMMARGGVHPSSRRERARPEHPSLGRGRPNVPCVPRHACLALDSVWLLDDLARELERQGLSREEAGARVGGIRADIRLLTAELFRVRPIREVPSARVLPAPGCFMEDDVFYGG